MRHAFVGPWYLRIWGQAAVGLPSAVWVLWWGMLLNRIGGFVVPFLTLVLTARGTTVDDASLVLAAYGLGAFIASLVGGQLADRLGRKPTMLGSLVVGAASMLALSQAHSLAALTLGTLVMGASAEAYRPAMTAAMQDVLPPDRRRVGSGLLYWAVNAGFAAASILGGLALELGPSVLFVVDAVTMLACAAWLSVAFQEPSRTAVATPVVSARSLRGWQAHRALWLALPMTLAVALGMMQNTFALPLDMQAKGFGGTAFGLLQGINGVAVIVFQPMVTAWLQRYPLRLTLAVGTLAFGLGIGGYAMASAAWSYAACVLLWSVAEIAALPGASAYVMNIAPSDMRGRYQGAFGATWGLAAAIGPLLGGQLWLALGTGMWLVILAILTLAAAGYWWLVPAEMR